MGIEAIGGPNPEGLPLSEAIMAGDFIFVSGMVGFGSDGKIVPGGVAAETDQIMKDVNELLRKAGAGLEKVVKVTVYLADADDFEPFNKAYARHISGLPPARIGIVAAFTIDVRVEMDFVAYVGE